MKKILITYVLLMLITSVSFADGWNANLKGTRVSLQVYWKDHSIGMGDFPRDLVQIPTVSIDGNILYFYDVFSTTVPVFVVDASDNVVFSATLYPGEDKKVLPASLSGTYTLYMRVGTIMYSAVITI